MKFTWYRWALLLMVIGCSVVAFRPAKETTAPPPTDASRWFKGNTHTHSLWSDGNDFPEMIVSWYKNRGYDFLALSDHNILSRGEKWMPVAQVENRRRTDGPGTMAGYLEAFGETWVETRGAPDRKEVRLKTLAEIRPRFEEAGSFLLIEAEEITDRFRKHQIHINALNLDEVIPPQHGNSVVQTMRNNLRKVREQAEKLDRPILAHINHPNFHFSISGRDLAEVVEERFFEVYNGHPSINHLGNEDHPGDQQIWDIANTLRLMVHKAPPLFGVATDDSHHYHGGNASPGRGWVMVRAPELTTDALIRAMERGDFYASTGVVLEDVGYDRPSRTLRLRIQPAQGATYETRFIGTRISTPESPGEVLETTTGTEASYRLGPDDLYVRAVVTSSRAHPNPSYPDQAEQAWTQPVGWRE